MEATEPATVACQEGSLLMPRAVPVIVLVLAATVAVAGALVAQSNTGAVYGRVTDEHGSPIAGGTATLTGPAAPQTATVDAQGLFHFLQVPPDTYSLAVSVPGFATLTRQEVAVAVGRNVHVDFPLQPAGVREDVTVRGDTSLVDRRKVATGESFSGRQLTEVPTSRDVWSLVQQVPGVQLDTVNVAGSASADLSGPRFASRGSGNVTYAIDGATVTNNTYGFALQRQNGATSTYFDFGTFQEVEVVTGGSSLDQQTSGVTINVVTKRGTNELKGSARFLYASASWQSDNTPESSVEQGLQTNRTRFIREYGAELGGPILEDRLWLWAAGARQDISLSPTTLRADEIPYPQTTTLEPWSAKLNAQISNANSAAMYYQRSDRLAYGTEAFSDRPYETRTNVLIPADFYKVEDSNVFSPDLFASAFVAYQSTNFQFTPVGGLDRDIQFYDDSFHNSYFYSVSKAPQSQASLQVTRFFEAGALNHEVKFGFGYRQLTADTTVGLPGSQNWGSTFADGFADATLTRGVRRIYRTEYWTGTLGDTLTARDLTISAGVRFDLQRARNLPGRTFANPLFSEPCPTCGPEGFPGLPELRYHGAPDWQVQFTNWQPRVSATWAPGTGQATLLRASYARYVDQLGYLPALLNGLPDINGYGYGWNDLNQDHDVQPNEVDWNVSHGTWNGVDPATLPTTAYALAPDFRTPATDEITAGIDQQLGKTLAVSGTFSYRSTSRLQAQVPAGTSPSSWALGGHATGTVTDAEGFRLVFDEPYYILTLPEAPSGYVLENRPGATQRYFGLDVSVEKSLSDHWMLRCNFGWSSFRQYITPQSILNPNDLWGLGGQNDDGGLSTGASDKRNVWMNAGWQFNLNGLYQGPWGLTLGANFYGRQGYPRPYSVYVRTNDVAFNNWSILIDRMDTYRYPDVYQLDLRLQRPFQVGPVTVTPAVELFNATNGNSLLNSDPEAGTYDPAGEKPFLKNPSFNQTIEIQSPRIVRLGVQVSF